MPLSMMWENVPMTPRSGSNCTKTQTYSTRKNYKFSQRSLNQEGHYAYLLTETATKTYYLPMTPRSGSNCTKTQTYSTRKNYKFSQRSLNQEVHYASLLTETATKTY